MLSFIKKIVGTKNDREIKRLRPYVDEINKFEDEFKGLTDDQLRAKTEQFKKRIVEADGDVAKRTRRAARGSGDGGRRAARGE
jgi:preprotein translocase subunit SecA